MAPSSLCIVSAFCLVQLLRLSAADGHCEGVTLTQGTSVSIVHPNSIVADTEICREGSDSVELWPACRYGRRMGAGPLQAGLSDLRDRNSVGLLTETTFGFNNAEGSAYYDDQYGSLRLMEIFSAKGGKRHTVLDTPIRHQSCTRAEYNGNRSLCESKMAMFTTEQNSTNTYCLGHYRVTSDNEIESATEATATLLWLQGNNLIMADTTQRNVVPCLDVKSLFRGAECCSNEADRKLTYASTPADNETLRALGQANVKTCGEARSVFHEDCCNENETPSAYVGDRVAYARQSIYAVLRDETLPYRIDTTGDGKGNMCLLPAGPKMHPSQWYTSVNASDVTQCRSYPLSPGTIKINFEWHNSWSGMQTAPVDEVCMRYRVDANFPNATVSAGRCDQRDPTATGMANSSCPCLHTHRDEHDRNTDVCPEVLDPQPGDEITRLSILSGGKSIAGVSFVRTGLVTLGEAIAMDDESNEETWTIPLRNYWVGRENGLAVYDTCIELKGMKQDDRSRIKYVSVDPSIGTASRKLTSTPTPAPAPAPMYPSDVAALASPPPPPPVAPTSIATSSRRASCVYDEANAVLSPCIAKQRTRARNLIQMDSFCEADNDDAMCCDDTVTETQVCSSSPITQTE